MAGFGCPPRVMFRIYHPAPFTPLICTSLVSGPAVAWESESVSPSNPSHNIVPPRNLFPLKHFPASAAALLTASMLF